MIPILPLIVHPLAGLLKDGVLQRHLQTGIENMNSLPELAKLRVATQQRKLLNSLALNDVLLIDAATGVGKSSLFPLLVAAHSVSGGER